MKICTDNRNFFYFLLSKKYMSGYEPETTFFYWFRELEDGYLVEHDLADVDFRAIEDYII